MARKLDEIIAALPANGRTRVNDRAIKLATLKDPRKAAEQASKKLLARRVCD